MQIDPINELTLLENFSYERDSGSIPNRNRRQELERILLQKQQQVLLKKEAQGTLTQSLQKELIEIQSKLKTSLKPITKSQKLETKEITVNALKGDKINSLAYELGIRSHVYLKGKIILAKVQTPISIKNLQYEDLVRNFDKLYTTAQIMGLEVLERRDKNNSEQYENFKNLLEGILQCEYKFGRFNSNKVTLCSIFYAALTHPKENWPTPYSGDDYDTRRLFLEKISEITSEIEKTNPIKLQVSTVYSGKPSLGVQKHLAGAPVKRQIETAATISLEKPSIPTPLNPEAKHVTETFLTNVTNESLTPLLIPNKIPLAEYDLCQELNLKSFSDQLKKISIDVEMAPDIFQEEDKIKLARGQEIQLALKNIDEDLARIQGKEKEKDAVRKLKHAKKELTTAYNRIRDDKFLARQKAKFNEDYRQGRALNQRRKQIEELYRRRLLADTTEKESEQSSRQKHIKSLIQSENHELDRMQNAILTLANSTLHGERASLETRGLLIGKQLSRPTFQELIGYYLQRSPTQFQEKTKLDKQSIDELYQLIHQYLLKITANQHRERIETLYNELNTTPKESPEYQRLITKLGDSISAARAYDPSEHPEMLVFEYLENLMIRPEHLMIRPEQASIIARLLKQPGEGFNNEIVQLIMGGGKSKVLLPLLALKKATGTNLPIIVVPASLFETNAADMQAATQRLFGKTAHKFVFDRDTIDGKNCTARNLASFYKKLEKICTQQEYMITTAESMQSLQLKYLELLGKAKESKEAEEEPPVPDGVIRETFTEEEKNQIFYLEKILLLIKSQGDALIDECDTVLDIKRELNYTQGLADSISAQTLEAIQNLYKIFPKTIIQLSSGTQCTLEDIMLQKVIITKEEQWDQVFRSLVSQLVTHQESPLFPIASKLTPSESDILIEYLLNEAEAIPSFIFERYSDEERGLIGLMKGEIDLLRICLKRKPNEHYGFPLSPNYNGSKELAIPYLANNTPNERAQFGSFLEIINYTIQLQKQKEFLSLDVITECVEYFQTKAKDEAARAYGQKAFIDTPSAKEFLKITGIPLESIHLKDAEQMKTIQNNLSQNEAAKDYIVLKFILPKIKKYPHILRSNPINHVGQYRSAQAMSGTPWDKKCYHPSFEKADENEERAAEALSLGTDGKTIDLLKRKNPAIRVASDKTPKAIIEQRILGHPESSRIHALIDIGALFKGISNYAVARELAQALSKRKDNKIRHVLYFNEDNILCALPFEKSLEPPYHVMIANPIPIGSTEPQNIADKLGCKVHEFTEYCFTYYDQRHATGIDIKQAVDTIGLATIDNDTRARDLWQGVRRLRELDLNQTLEIVIPNELAEERPQKSWNIDDIIKVVQVNQEQILGERHLRSAFDKMNDVVRQALLDLIYKGKNINEKSRLRKIFEEVFMTSTEDDFFKRFKNCEGWVDTKIILSQHAKACLERYQSLITHASLEPGLVETKTIQDKLRFIQEKALQNCLEIYKHLSNSEHGQMVEVCQLQETLKERRNEKETQEQVQSVLNEEPKATKSWSKLNIFPKHLQAGRYSGQKAATDSQTIANEPEYITVASLNDMLISTNTFENWSFSSNIFVSENYQQTLFEQMNQMDHYIKPVNFFMVIQEPGDSPLKTMLITQQEATEFMHYLDKNRDGLIREGYGIWINTPHDTLLTGTSPEIDNKNYAEILEQIQFFNGDLNKLSQNNQFNWMLQNNAGKINFLTNVILKNFPEKKKFLPHFLDVQTQYFKKLSGDTKITSESLFKAILSGDLKSLNALLLELGTIQDPRVQIVILNQISAKSGLSLLGTAVQMGSPSIVKRLLEVKTLYEDPKLKKSAIRLSMQKFHAETFQSLLQDPRLLPKLNDTKNWVDLLNQALRIFVKTGLKEPLINLVETLKRMGDVQSINNIIAEVIKTIDKQPSDFINPILMVLEKSTGDEFVWKQYILMQFQKKDFDSEQFLKRLYELKDAPPSPALKAYLNLNQTGITGISNILIDMLEPRNIPYFLWLLDDEKFSPSTVDLNGWFYLLDRIANNQDLILFKSFIQILRKRLSPENINKLLNGLPIEKKDPTSNLKRLNVETIVNEALQHAYPAKQCIEKLSILLQIYPTAEDNNSWKSILERLVTLQSMDDKLKIFEVMLSRPFPSMEFPIKTLLELLLKRLEFGTIGVLLKLMTEKGLQKSLMDSRLSKIFDEMLQVAIQYKDWNSVERFLQCGAKVNDPEQAMELLAWAISTKKIELVKNLLAEKVQPKQFAGEDNIVLSTVFKPEYSEIACIFLEKMGDPEARNYKGNFFEYVKHAFAKNNTRTLEILDQYNSLKKLISCPKLLSDLIRVGDPNAIQQFFKVFTYAHPKFLLNSPLSPASDIETPAPGSYVFSTSPQETPLDIALKTRNESLLLTLIELGAEPRVDHLYQAIEWGSIALVQAILRTGKIYVDSTSNRYLERNSLQMVTPLYLAMEQGKDDIAMILLNGDANPNAIPRETRFQNVINRSIENLYI